MLNDQDQNLLNKFSSAVGPDLDEKSAVKLLASLNKQEYERLIEIFKNNDFPNIKAETKEKVLIILRKLHDAF